MKWRAWIAVPLFLAGVAWAQDIKLNVASAHDVAEARWVVVVAYTGSDVPIADPQENQRAVRDVQNAILKRGKYQVTSDPTEADLIIALRKGRAGSATINGTRNRT